MSLKKMPFISSVKLASVDDSFIVPTTLYYDDRKPLAGREALERCPPPELTRAPRCCKNRMRYYLITGCRHSVANAYSRHVPCVDGPGLARRIFTMQAWSVQPCVDGPGLARRIFTMQAWSVQPCVRPLDAVHMTAGHNALRGSGPGQKPAFDNALAHVGCPDRRIDRLCITCCSPSQPSHRADVRRDLVTPPVRIAQAIRAILLASAIATTFVGRRANNAASQGRCLVPWILA
jgi:hypothetical protein